MSECGTARYSDETRIKHEQLGGLFRMYAAMVNGIYRRRGAEFVYVDLNAGPGHYDHGASGSPLLASYAFSEFAWCSALHCFEVDGETYERLAEATASHPKVITHWEDHAVGIASVLRQHPRHTYGLVFADANPGIDNVPIDVLHQTAVAWPKVDLLCYVSAAVMKRMRTTVGGPSLRAALSGIGKSHCLIRNPRGRHQWTFVLLTNWGEFPAWRKEGFVPLNSETGQQILSTLDLTRREFVEQSQRDLFSDDA